MQRVIDPVYQAAYREVLQMRRSLEELMQHFQDTFTLTRVERELLHVRAELHNSGRAIEIFTADMDVVFSLGTVFDRRSERDAWELVAFHETSSIPQWVCTMRVGPTTSDYARRIHGARLIAAVGHYLEWQGETERDAVGVQRVETNRLSVPQIAARNELQPV